MLHLPTDSTSSYPTASCFLTKTIKQEDQINVVLNAVIINTSVSAQHWMADEQNQLVHRMFSICYIYVMNDLGSSEVMKN